jgi:formylglycine-generating enzyme required for sulfatase activity
VKKLSAKTGQKYRLPSEAEWEYAARAGTTTPFHTGQTITTGQANFHGDYTYNGSAKGEYRQKSVPVGSFKANDFDLNDMHGNVFEWVQDCWHETYENAPINGGSWETNCKDTRRVLRGGSWSGYPRFLRSADRDRDAPVNRSGDAGFRVARTFSL